MSSSDSELQLLETIYSKQDGSAAISQRDLAGASGLSLGMTNALLRRFIERGWVKLTHISGRSLKYILTAAGAEEVLRRSLSYFTRAVRSASLYRDKIDDYVLGLSKAGFKTLVLEGPAELDFLFDYSCARHGLDFVKNPPEASRQAYLASALAVFVTARSIANPEEACDEAGAEAASAAVAQASRIHLADILFDCADIRARAADKALAQAAADKAAADKAAADKAAAQAAADKAAAEKAALARLSASAVASPARFSPDGDGKDDSLTFNLGADSGAGIAEWKLEVFEKAVVESAKAGAPAQQRLFMSWAGKGNPPETITWNGQSSAKELVQSASDYPFTFTVKDKLGKSASSTGSVAVDVLVVKAGENLMVKVPSIVFRSNYADFNNLGADVIENNEVVIAQIAQILNKYPEYNIKIQGHANSAAKIAGLSQTKIQEEETKELLPLSLGRAKLVMSLLIKDGVDPKRLTAEGLGSSKPVVSFQDAANRWKNRRVEFILIKK